MELQKLKQRLHPLHGVNIYIATKAVDFRKGHDGLAAWMQSHLGKEPFDGAVYVPRKAG